MRSLGPRPHRYWCVCSTVIGFLLCAPRLEAQAWVPQKGQGSVTLLFQNIRITGHRLGDGTPDRTGKHVTRTIYLETEYAVTNRLSFTLGLPYVFAKYTDTQPPPGPHHFYDRDKCRCWKSGPQDFIFSARYNILRAGDGSFSLTPSVTGVIPSNHYEVQGVSIQGRRLREMILAVDAGKRLDAITPRLSITGRYSYAIVERLDHLPNNRSNFALGGRYVWLGGRLAAQGYATWQVTHGGLGTLQAVLEHFEEHDRMLQDNHFYPSGSLTYAFPRFDVFAAYLWLAKGTFTHMGQSMTIGVSWPFEIRRRGRRDR